MSDRRYDMNFSEVCYEDQLPEDMTDADYESWFSWSRVDGVRIGPAVTRRTPPQPEKPT